MVQIIYNNVHNCFVCWLHIVWCMITSYMKLVSWALTDWFPWLSGRMWVFVQESQNWKESFEYKFINLHITSWVCESCFYWSCLPANCKHYSHVPLQNELSGQISSNIYIWICRSACKPQYQLASSNVVMPNDWWPVLTSFHALLLKKSNLYNTLQV